MAVSDFIFTSESVAEGHPYQVCGRISDAIVDLYLGADPQSRIAVDLVGQLRGAF